jgi:cytochrome c oxidase assembly factor CtaG
MSADPHIVWTFDVGPLAAMAVGAFVYVRRFRRARVEAGGRGAGLPQAVAFAAAMLVLLAALVSPVDGLGENYLFSAHMTQHDG